MALLKFLATKWIEGSSVGTTGDTRYMYTLASESRGTTNVVVPLKMAKNHKIAKNISKTRSKLIYFCKLFKREAPIGQVF